jgi:hypothetical protein
MASETPITSKVERTSSELFDRFNGVLPDLANSSGRATTAGMRFVVLAPAVILVGLAAFLLALDKCLLDKHSQDEIASLDTQVSAIEREFAGVQR